VSFIDVSLVPPGGEIGLHTHALDNEEIYIIMSGSARMNIDGKNITAVAGDIIINKPGGTHGLVNPGPETVQLVVLEVRTAS
jgi:mannose-6-phosphate isomerase-like protein (cupin superfamily)